MADNLVKPAELTNQITYELNPDNLTEAERDKIIKDGLKAAIKISEKIRPTETLVQVCYAVLRDFFINNKRFVAVEAPTGSGKSVIGYVMSVSFRYCMEKICGIRGATSFLLTSSKMLQQQIQGDFKSFGFEPEDFAMLKGCANYPCLYKYFMTLQEKKSKESLLGAAANSFHNSSEKIDPRKYAVPYTDRHCAPMTSESREKLPCYETCHYINARRAASGSYCANLNYAYFLTVLNADNNPYFGKRHLTIADEGHLIPDIVSNMFMYEISRYPLARLEKIMKGIRDCYPNFDEVEAYQNKKLNDEYIEKFKDYEQQISFYSSLFVRSTPPDFKHIIEYVQFISDVKFFLCAREDKTEDFKKRTLGLFAEVSKEEDEERVPYNVHNMKELAERPEDIYIAVDTSLKYTKFIVRDLSEIELCRKHFLKHTEFCLLLSATLGNTNEYGKLLGIPDEDYSAYRIGSTFDFSKSPIVYTNSGYLTYKEYEKNIDKVLYDCLYICAKYHPNHKGIIHTSTFANADRLYDALIALNMNGRNPFGEALQISRFRFYKTASQKDACIKEMKSSKDPLVVVGPSLYEGLDLKHDDGRFNILLKVPYPGIDDYVRKKMERVNFWYERVTVEKIVQAIGRTNRAVDDWSVTYLLDSQFKKLFTKMYGNRIPERITHRSIELPENFRPYSEISRSSKRFSIMDQLKTDKSPVSTIDNDLFDDLPF